MVNTDTDSLTNSKINQSSKNDTKQLCIKNVKNDINNRFMICHQNIRGLKGKINEFLLSLSAEVPHLICFTEQHHLKDYELVNIHIPKYKLGANYCRKNLKQGGICIYVCEYLTFTNIDLLKYNKEHDIEIAVIELNTQKRKVIIICIYRAPCGNFECFLNKLEIILNSLHKCNSEFIICGDIIINYLEFNNKKNQLDNLLGTYNLSGTVLFPTRIVSISVTLIDNIDIDNRRTYIKPCSNGLLDHDGQTVTLFN